MKVLQQCSTVGKQRPEKLGRQGLKDGCGKWQSRAKMTTGLKIGQLGKFVAVRYDRAVRCKDQEAKFDAQNRRLDTMNLQTKTQCLKSCRFIRVQYAVYGTCDRWTLNYRARFSREVRSARLEGPPSWKPSPSPISPPGPESPTVQSAPPTHHKTTHAHETCVDRESGFYKVQCFLMQEFDWILKVPAHHKFYCKTQ